MQVSFHFYSSIGVFTWWWASNRHVISSISMALLTFTPAVTFFSFFSPPHPSLPIPSLKEI